MNIGIRKVATAIAGPNANAISMLNIGAEYWRVDRTVEAPGPDLSEPGKNYVWITPDLIEPETAAAAVHIRVKCGEADTVLRIAAFSDVSLAKYGGHEELLLADASAFDFVANTRGHIYFAIDAHRSLGVLVEEGGLASIEITWILTP